MQELVKSPFAAWESYYVIVGSSAAALTGLQFVVIALIPQMRRPGGPREIEAFGTPTVVHFCAALLIAAILSAPWQLLSTAASALGLVGFLGTCYVGIVTRRAKRQTGYTPVFEDWLWHVVLPFAAYVTLFVAALVTPRRPAGALFAIGAVALLLLFIGIHNAWDTVTYIAVGPGAEAAAEPERSARP